MSNANVLIAAGFCGISGPPFAEMVWLKESSVIFVILYVSDAKGDSTPVVLSIFEQSAA